ncbi:MAG: methylase [Hyphomicrobiales bacterium]|nr:MAG: methylase [Hyphomicrobiales bacterium]
MTFNSSYSQAAENNKGPIGEVLVEAFASCRHVLELASGTGQHAVYLSRLMPHLVWQTSDLDVNLEIIAARVRAEGGANLRAPIALDVADLPWPVPPVDAVFAANAVHIMSWNHVIDMFQGLDPVLEKGGLLALYGPYKYGGAFTTDSNARFDEWLKARDPLSGIRDFEAVDDLAAGIGLALQADHPMPANNQLLIWRRG